MSASTRPIHGNESSVNESRFLGHAQASGTLSNPRVTASEDYDMSPRVRKIVFLFLLAGIVFLGSVAAYVWYGFSQWKNIP